MANQACQGSHKLYGTSGAQQSPVVSHTSPRWLPAGPPTCAEQSGKTGFGSFLSRKLVASHQTSARTVLPFSAASTTLLSAHACDRISCIPVLARYRVEVGTSGGGGGAYGTPGTSHANRQNLCWVAHAGGTTGCTPLNLKALVARTRFTACTPYSSLAVVYTLDAMTASRACRLPAAAGAFYSRSGEGYVICLLLSMRLSSACRV